VVIREVHVQRNGLCGSGGVMSKTKEVWMGKVLISKNMSAAHCLMLSTVFFRA